MCVELGFDWCWGSIKIDPSTPPPERNPHPTPTPHLQLAEKRKARLAEAGGGVSVRLCRICKVKINSERHYCNDCSYKKVRGWMDGWMGGLLLLWRDYIEGQCPEPTNGLIDSLHTYTYMT